MLLIEAWMAHEGYAEDCWRLEGWQQSGKINKMTERRLCADMCPTEINISLKLLSRANLKQMRVPNCTYMRNHHHVGTPGLHCQKKLAQKWINTLHVCPNSCLSVFENLSTVHRKICGDGVFTICLARQRKRGDDIISLPSGAYREPGLVVKTIDHQGWTRYIWCHDDVLKRVSSVRGCVLEKSRRNSSWKKMSSLATFVWWVFCGVMGPLTVCIVTMSGSQVLHIQYSST